MILDKRLIRRSFSQAAPGYDGVAQLQRLIGDRLQAYLPLDGSAMSTVLDAGTGTGGSIQHLSSRYPHCQLIGLDLAEGMLQQQARNNAHASLHLVGGDIEAMPLRDSAIDLAFSNLALQWCNLLQAFKEFWRVLKPGGRLLCSTFTTQTLCELRQAWLTVDDYTHVNRFPSVDETLDCLSDSGLRLIFRQAYLEQIDYPHVMALMRELKTLGAHNITPRRARGLTGKHSLQRMLAAYRALCGTDTIAASFEVVLIVAEKPL